MAVTINNNVTGGGNIAKTQYPADSIGADLSKRNYVRYLVERYHRFKEADSSLGKTRPFSYAVIYRNIERHFKAPTYFIPVHRFDELVTYLQGCVDRTLLGKRNKARQQGSYQTFDEYELDQSIRPSP